MGAHFDRAALDFLKSLSRHNDREWFNARKPVYEREVKGAMQAVVAEVNHAMERFAPDYVRDPAKSVMRIYRDIRFSKNKTPYKTNVAAWWAKAGQEKTSGGGFYVELSPTGLVVAAGAYLPERDETNAIRRMLLDRYAEYRRLMASRSLKRYGMVEFDGQALTRAPKGFPTNHPADDLIRRRQWGVSASLPAELALGDGLVKAVVLRLRAAAPLVELLNAPLQRKPAKPLF